MNPTASDQDQCTCLLHTRHTKDTGHGYHTHSKHPLNQQIGGLPHMSQIALLRMSKSLGVSHGVFFQIAGDSDCVSEPLLPKRGGQILCEKKGLKIYPVPARDPP